MINGPSRRDLLRPYLDVVYFLIFKGRSIFIYEGIGFPWVHTHILVSNFYSPFSLYEADLKVRSFRKKLKLIAVDREPLHEPWGFLEVAYNWCFPGWFRIIWGLLFSKVGPLCLLRTYSFFFFVFSIASNEFHLKLQMLKIFDWKLLNDF